MASKIANKSVAPPAANVATQAQGTPAAAKRASTSSKKQMPLPVAKSAAKPAQVASAKPTSSKLLKPKKIILVRDSFTIPKLEYLMLDTLKLRAGALGKPVKKSELIRAGIKALAAMPDSQFYAVVLAVAPVKADRPAKD